MYVHNIEQSGRAPWGVRHAAPRALPDGNRRLGDLQVTVRDLDDDIVFTVRERAYAGARVGSPLGYASLGTALARLGRLTLGDVPAAAIIERGGRYYGHVLKSVTVGSTSVTMARPMHLEPDTLTAVEGVKALGRFERFAAIVDGAWQNTFRS